MRRPPRVGASTLPDDARRRYSGDQRSNPPLRIAARAALHGFAMTKTEKTTDEIRQIILDRTGLKVTVRPHESRGWIATPYTLYHYTPSDLGELDRLVLELQRKYAIKTGAA